MMNKTAIKIKKKMKKKGRKINYLFINCMFAVIPFKLIKMCLKKKSGC